MSPGRALLARSRLIARHGTRAFGATTRSSRPVPLNERANDTAEQYRKFQIEKPLNPHLTNTNSTIANELPSLGKDGPPPELLTSADPTFTPKDSHPENTERMTGGTQRPGPTSGPNAELDVGEIQGASFRVEPLRRVGEDANTMRARLLYQSRKRGTLESDLLLSTFADENLATMTPTQLQQFDLFLDENDWDIYYWATQEPSPTSVTSAEGEGPQRAAPDAQGQSPAHTPEQAPPGSPASGTRARGSVGPSPGEWAQTVGAFKPAYRPVPARWKNSEILSLLRKHVKNRSAGGVHVAGDEATKAEGTGQGMGFMPPLKTFDA